MKDFGAVLHYNWLRIVTNMAVLIRRVMIIVKFVNFYLLYTNFNKIYELILIPKYFITSLSLAGKLIVELMN